MPDDTMPDDTDDTAPHDIESRLRHALALQAGAEPVAPADWGVLAGRLASTTRRRQRALVGAAALALVIGAAGGYFGEAAASPVAVRASGPGSTPTTTAASGGTRSVAPSSSGPAALCPNGSGGSPGASSGTTSTNGSLDIGSATRVFTRTTTDGVTIRVYQDARTGVSCLGPPTPMAGPASGSTSRTTTTTSGSASSSVFPTGPETTIELSDDNAVGQGAITPSQCVMSPAGGVVGGSGSGSSNGAQPGSSPASPVTTNPVPTNPVPTTPITTIPTTTTTTTTPSSAPGVPSGLATGVFGIAEGDPVWWVAVEVGTDVTSVRMTFPEGTSDEMAPVGGVAVLAHRVAPAVASAGTGPYEVRGTLDLLGAGGVVLNTVTLPEQSAPVPVPTPLSIPGSGGTQTVAPNVIEVCPPTMVPQAQSSATTEKR
jgi:hypothetical protein